VSVGYFCKVAMKFFENLYEPGSYAPLG